MSRWNKKGAESAAAQDSADKESEMGKKARLFRSGKRESPAPADKPEAREKFRAKRRKRADAAPEESEKKRRSASSDELSPPPPPEKPFAPPKSGVVVFETEGIGHARLLSRLSSAAPLKGIRSRGRKLVFSAEAKYSGKIIALLEELSYNYKIKEVRGALPYLRGVLARFGVTAGLAASIAALAVYPMFVTGIECSGELKPEVWSILSSHGVEKGAFLPRFDGVAVSSAIAAVDGVSFARVEKRGTRVYVEVVNELEVEDFIDLPAGEIKAVKRAVVTRTIVYSGTAEVKAGDVVSPGDLLIGGYTEVGEERVEAPASGEVFGKTYYEKSIWYPDTEIAVIEGEVKSITRLSFFGSKFKSPKPPFENYRLEIREEVNSFMFPYRIRTYIYTELKAVERACADTDEELTLRTRSSLFTELPPGAAVLDGWTTVTRTEGGRTVKAVFECEERIDR